MNPTIDAPLEVLTPNALESLERAHIDVQVATAHKFPRSMAMFKKRALDMVQQDIETAESCIYSRPVGGGKTAEGASIRMAEIVAACYGNIRVGARIIEQTERFVKAEGVAHDLESNYAAKSEAMESTVKKDGTPYDERMRIVVAKAALSKALRDSIFRVVPKALCKSIYDAALEVINKQSKTLDQRRASAKAWTESLKVSDERVFAVLGVKGWEEVTADHLLKLTGLKTAMKDDGLEINEVFPPIATNAGSNLAPKMPTGTVTGTGTPSNVVPLTPAGASQTPAKAAETTPKATETAKPAESATAAATATAQPAKTEAKEVQEAPKCKYCKEPVTNMAEHNCAQMQEALNPKPAKTAEPAKETEPEPPPTKPAATTPAQPGTTATLAKLYDMMAAAEITPEAVLKFCVANEMAKKTQKLADLAESKHQKIIDLWDNITDEIKKFQQ